MNTDNLLGIVLLVTSMAIISVAWAERIETWRAEDRAAAALPVPPADDVHRTVQETCIRCHVDEGVLK